MNRHTGAHIQHKHVSVTILILFEKILNKVWNKKCQSPHHHMLPSNLKTGEELPIARCACVTLLWVLKSPSVFTSYNPQRMVRGTESKRLWSSKNILSPAGLCTSRHVCEHVCQCLYTCKDLCLWVGWGGGEKQVSETYTSPKGHCHIPASFPQGRQTSWLCGWGKCVPCTQWAAAGSSTAHWIWPALWS